MMKHILKLLVISCIFSSCTNKKELSVMERAQLVEKLSNEPAVQRVKSALAHENQLMAEGKIDFSNFNHDLVNREIKNCKTLPEKIALYKKAGMKDPQSYLLAIKELDESMMELRRTIPEIWELNPEDFSKLIRPSKKSHEQVRDSLMKRSNISLKKYQKNAENNQ